MRYDGRSMYTNKKISGVTLFLDGQYEPTDLSSGVIPFLDRQYPPTGLNQGEIKRAQRRTC